MKPTLRFFLAVCLFTSCTQYHYLTIAGVNVPKTEKNEFVSENDTLRVEYRFAQEYGLVSIRVFNKTAEPFEVEWQKSAFIINDQTVGYYDNKHAFAGKIESDTWRSGWSTNYTTGNVNGLIQGSEQTQFVPPISFVESRMISIPLHSVLNLTDENAEKLLFKLSADDAVKYKRIPFRAENTPTRLRSYLTFRIGRDAQKQFSVEHRFYISEIWKSNSGPETFASIMHNRGDMFYISQ